MNADDRRKPRVIRLETDRYVVRTLDPDDATENWGEWPNDEEAARALNNSPQRITREQDRTYIERFDRVNAHLLGIFEKETGTLVGFRSIYINWEDGSFLVNTLIGEREARNKGARTETRDVVFHYFFFDLDLRTAHGTALADNETILRAFRRKGWIHERTVARPASGGGTVDILHFTLPRERWRGASEQDADRGSVDRANANATTVSGQHPAGDRSRK